MDHGWRQVQEDRRHVAWSAIDPGLASASGQVEIIWRKSCDINSGSVGWSVATSSLSAQEPPACARSAVQLFRVRETEDMRMAIHAQEDRQAFRVKVMLAKIRGDQTAQGRQVDRLRR